MASVARQTERVQVSRIGTARFEDLGGDPELSDSAEDLQRRSHATGLTLAFQNLIGSEDLQAIGGHYDRGKENAYRSDLTKIAAFARDVTTFIDRLGPGFPPRE